MDPYRRFLPLLLGALILNSCKGPAARLEQGPQSSSVTEWKVIGPGGGGGVMKPTVSPFDEDFVITHCDMTAAYISHDGGRNWKMKNLYNVPEDIEFDPADSNTVYICTRGFLYSEDRGSGISLVLRSDDRGSSWRIIYPDVSRAQRTERLQSTRLRPSQVIEGALDGTIQKVRVDPSDNKRIFAGLSPLVDYMGPRRGAGKAEPAKLIMSSDRGTTWKVLADLPGRNILGIFPFGTDNQVTVLTEGSCLRINTETGEKTLLSIPVKNIQVTDGGQDGNSSLIYIQSAFSQESGKYRGGIYVTSDRGNTWNQVNTGLLEGMSGNRLPRLRQGLAVCHTQPATAYISIEHPVPDANGQVEEIYGIYKTVNAGKNWEPVLLSSTPRGYITGNFRGSWMEQSFDPGWGGSPIDMGVAPGNPDVCYCGDNGRGYRTTDGGKSWEQLYSHNQSDGTYASSGLDVTTCYGVHFDPFDKEHIFICYTDIGLFHSFNGGYSWAHSLRGIPREWQNTCYDLVFDPDVKGRLWSAWANAHDLPRTKMFGGDGFDMFQGGIARSEDSGRSWIPCNPGLPENSVCTGILLDARSEAAARILYVSVFDQGIYKSADGGDHWTPMNKGLGDNLFAWQIRQDRNGRLYALFARGLRNGRIVDGAIYCSDDGGGNWNRTELPPTVNGPHDLLIYPLNPDIMYVSCWPHQGEDSDTGGGFIKTSDGGKTWEQVFDDRVRVNSAGLDPAKPGTIYINTFQNAAYRSEDAGRNWQRIEGYRFKWGQRAIPDINHPGMLFLTSYGGSVFHGPASGVAGAKDDILNMPEGWW